MVSQVIEEYFFTDKTTATDATHFVARDQAPPKDEKQKIELKKRGSIPKEERDGWLKEQAEKKASLPLYGKVNFCTFASMPTTRLAL